MSDRHTSRILDHIADRRYEPRTLRQLMAELGIPKDQQDDFRQAAEKLLKEDQIVLGSENTVGLPPVGDTMVGRYRSHERGFGFIIPDALTEHGDLFVPPGNMADAMDGDRVRAKVIRSRGGRGPGKSPYTGRIIEVLQRADRQFVGTLIQRGKTFLVQPDGRKLGDPIVVRDAQSTNAKLGDKVVVDIIDYPDANKNELAEGVITEVLGESGIPDVETQSVIRAYGLGGKFSKEVMQQARDAALKMEGTEDAIPADREDLREALILTIDPPDAKDFDDAISITKLSQGEAAWELGVHIADVAHFVEPGSALDQEAYERGNSTYLPRKVIPMLPEVLSNGVCSLQEGVDRYAKSVFITYDKAGKVLTQRFAKTIIRSSKRLTYLEAQALIDDDIREAKKHSRSTQSPIKYPRPVIQSLKLMDELAKVIRQRRLNDGMISLGLPEVELVFGESGHVVDAVEEDDAFTHTLIEMCMVEANEAAARVFHAIGVPMVRRTHPDPDSHGLKDLRMFARVAGYNIPANPSRQEMQWLLDKVRDTPAQHAVHMAVLKTLSKAEYSPALIGHFALASEHYTHFTSPIRRYPDFVVHRALNAILEAAAADKVLSKPIKPYGSSPALKKLGKKVAKDKRVPSEDDLKVIGRHCSDTERNSESAERELRKYLVLQLLETMLGDDFAATVTGVTGQGAFLQIDRYLVDGFVKLDALPGDKADRWKLNPNTGALVAQRSGRTISIGDRFTVRIADIDLPRRQMELVVLDDRNPKRGGKAHQPDKKGKGKKRRGDAKSHELARAKSKHKSGKVGKRKKPSTMQKKRPRKRR